MNTYIFEQNARGTRGAKAHMQTIVRKGPAMCKDWVRFAIVCANAELADHRERYWLRNQPVQTITTRIYRNGDIWGRIMSDREKIDDHMEIIQHTIIPSSPYREVCTISTLRRAEA